MRHKENSRDLTPLLRIETILGLTRDGLPFSEIQKRLQELPLNQDQLYSVVSVEKTVRSLKQIPFITEIAETVAWSDEDTIQKRDLIVNLSGKNVDFVGIQIKSSIYRVLEFYNKIDPNYESAQQILTQRKLIVINGQLPEAVIIKFFLDKLDLIDQYYQSHPSGNDFLFIPPESFRRRILCSL